MEVILFTLDNTTYTVNMFKVRKDTYQYVVCIGEKVLLKYQSSTVQTFDKLSDTIECFLNAGGRP